MSDLPADLATRIAAARRAAGLTQRELAERLSQMSGGRYNIRTVQSWESDGRVPRDLDIIERALSATLRVEPENSEDALLRKVSDAHLVSEYARRLSERDSEIRRLRAQIEDATAATPAPDAPVLGEGRWVARPRGEG